MRTAACTSLCIVLLSALAGGCAVDATRPAETGTSSDGGEVAGVEQGVHVRTRFVIADIDAIPENVALSGLTLNVGAVFLEPIGSSQRDVTFANRTPVTLDFDIEHGRLALSGPSLYLPWGGDFAVSVQVEPADTLVDDRKDGHASSSVVATGVWTQRHTVTDVVADEPSPLPWRQKERLQRPVEIVSPVDFAFRSDSVVRIQLAEVSLAENGDYELTLSLRLADWLRESVVPALEVEAERTIEPFAEFDSLRAISVDVDNDVESEAYGIEALVGDIDVHASRR